MAQSPEPATSSKPPSSDTFSFIAPFPATSPSCAHLKQRRVSLATPSSPRLVPAWSFRDDTGLSPAGGSSSDAETPREKKGKMRKIMNDQANEEGTDRPREKKPRKKWTMEETQMLVDGCNTWGVGNWKSILKDPNLKFDNRSPVDLKDRFRTYFPDAYKQHYPNAKTHLSSKVRSTLPDGTSLFEKTRSKKRRPFTEEEDKALKAGYEKHGTIWATIVKDPVFQEHNRRSTDLRDRFRNAFPDLYEAAGYKPRRTIRKKKGNGRGPIRAATDDQLMSAIADGASRRKRAHTKEGLYRGGTKSVPESVTNSEDEDSSGDEEDNEAGPSIIPKDASTPEPEPMQHVEETNLVDSLVEPISEFLPDSSQSNSDQTDSSHTWSSAFEPLPGANSWSTAAAASPTSSHLSSDYFLNQSPFSRRGSESVSMIGKSAWGAQDWFSPNPRLDSTASSSSSSFLGGLSPTPSSPFSFHNLSHGVVDRYDLFPTSFPTDFASEVGLGDTHSTFSDPEMFTSSNFRGFTHHSNYAGDLIFGTRTHQPSQPNDNSGFATAGLGLSGLHSQPAGIHPMQLHTPALPGIDEIELGAITLNDHPENPDDAMEGTTEDIRNNGPEEPLSLSDIPPFSLQAQSLEDIVGLSQDMHITPPATPISISRPFRSTHTQMSSVHNRSVSVPPNEHRTIGRSSHTQPGSKAPPTPTRSASFFDSIFQTNDELSVRSMSVIPMTSSPNDMWRQSNDHDVPFLDLHYFGPASGGSDNMETIDPSQLRQGQALDLAQSFTAARPPSIISPSFTQHVPTMAQSNASPSVIASRHTPVHHRGQSAISPQDLLMRDNSDNNKRKRASWDGGTA